MSREAVQPMRWLCLAAVACSDPPPEPPGVLVQLAATPPRRHVVHTRTAHTAGFRDVVIDRDAGTVAIHDHRDGMPDVDRVLLIDATALASLDVDGVLAEPVAIAGGSDQQLDIIDGLDTKRISTMHLEGRAGALFVYVERLASSLLPRLHQIRATTAYMLRDRTDVTIDLDTEQLQVVTTGDGRDGNVTIHLDAGELAQIITLATPVAGETATQPGQIPDLLEELRVVDDDEDIYRGDFRAGSHASELFDAMLRLANKRR